ncbi:MAG: YbaN family protein [Desulfuromonadales bacterium]|nr:YbaN family protein [Desulfuromonadales bacterium]MBN2793667.1 YbaN family protein [Desulfuromonadales bacterium]
MKASLVRISLTAIGLVSTAVGVIGIFVPLLPTVPLLLLAAACFARSSERFHNWLLGHPALGPMIRDYMDGQGIPLRAKIMAIGMIWLSIAISVLFLIPLVWVKVFLIAIGLCVTIYLLRLPMREE